MENKWELNIEKVSNGYVLTGKFGDSEIIEKKVITLEENLEIKNAKLEAIRQVMWEVQEFFGVYNSKHDKYNLDIKIIENESEE